MGDPTQALAERVARRLWGPECTEGLNDSEHAAAVPLIAAELRPAVEALEAWVDWMDYGDDVVPDFDEEQRRYSKADRATRRALSLAAGETEEEKKPDA